MAFFNNEWYCPYCFETTHCLECCEINPNAAAKRKGEA